MESKKYLKYKEQIKKYSEKHKEEIANYKRKWREENKDKQKKHEMDTRSRLFFGGLRTEALDRDSWICKKCGMTNEEHLDVYGRQITVDHIDGDKENNVLSNLQTLCLKCHSSKDRRRILNQTLK